MVLGAIHIQMAACISAVSLSASIHSPIVSSPPPSTFSLPSSSSSRAKTVAKMAADFFGSRAVVQVVLYICEGAGKEIDIPYSSSSNDTV